MSAPGDAAVAIYEDVGLRNAPSDAAIALYEDLGYRYPPQDAGVAIYEEIGYRSPPQDAAVALYEELPPLILAIAPETAFLAEVRGLATLMPGIRMDGGA